MSYNRYSYLLFNWHIHTLGVIARPYFVLILNTFIHTIISCLHTTYVQTWNTLLNNHKGKYESIDMIYKATTPSYSFYIVIDCILIPAHEATTNPDQQNWTKWICCTKFIHNVSIYTNRDDVGEYFMILWNNLMNCS